MRRNSLVVALVLSMVPQLSSAGQTGETHWFDPRTGQLDRTVDDLCSISRNTIEREFAGSMIKPLLTAANYATPLFANDGRPTPEELKTPRYRAEALSQVIRAARPDDAKSIAAAETAKADFRKVYSALAKDIQARVGQGNDNSFIARYSVVEEGTGLNDVPTLKIKWPFKVREDATGLIRNARVEFLVDLTAKGTTADSFAARILVEPQSAFKDAPNDIPIEYAMNAPFQQMSMQQFINFQVPVVCHLLQSDGSDYPLALPDRNAYPVSADNNKNQRSLPTLGKIQIESGGSATSVK